MFSYYGSKSKIVKYYPKPLHDCIIEPFAGSARYSLRHFDKEIILYDKYSVIVDIWKWLIECSPADITGLPKLTKGLKIDELGLSKPECDFLGMLAGVASTAPRNKVSPFAAEQNGYKNRLKRIADQLYKIKHWKIIHGSYEHISDREATWFIDPPYQFGGHAYIENKIDFKSLSGWCISRSGQIIVCENTKADWLPFIPMVIIRGAAQSYTTEAIYSNMPTSYNNSQTQLF